MSLSANTVQGSPPGGDRLLAMVAAGFGIAVGVGAAISAGIRRTPDEVPGYTRTAGLYFAICLIGGLDTLLR